MKKLLSFLFCLLLVIDAIQAQQGVTQCGTLTKQLKFPLQSYQELSVSTPFDNNWNTVAGTKVSWGSTDIRYGKHILPQIKQQDLALLQGWRGERVSAQAVVWTKTALEDLHFTFSDFKNSKGELLSKDVFKANFVRYVITDGLNKDGKGGCGERDHAEFDSILVADPIEENLASMKLTACTVQPIWVQCWIPQSIAPGIYKGNLFVKDGDRLLRRLNLEIKISSRQLPPPSEWTYHLDLWQNPFAVSRYYQTPLWSQEHFNAMRPLMKRLADAGQKVITASIMHKPWNGQTEDYYEAMVTWMKRADGTWYFDYTVFDKWVEFMISLGINKQINCYSMIPWKLSFQYFDQATNSLKMIQMTPGEQEYNEIWGQMLTSFSKHLREKGWFDICTIAMDERPNKIMQEALSVIRSADPEFKVSLAGHYHANLEKDIYDYCISIGQNYPEEVRSRRALENKPTTYYTSCSEAFPNLFTFSAPAEASWLSFYVAKKHLDGYLRWAYNSWPIEPLLDSRFRTWAGGDTYQVYPGNRSSIRFERLIEGIQAHEKITILRHEFDKAGNKAGLNQIEKMLSPFNINGLSEKSIAPAVKHASKILNSF